MQSHDINEECPCNFDKLPSTPTVCNQATWKRFQALFGNAALYSAVEMMLSCSRWLSFNKARALGRPIGDPPKPVGRYERISPSQRNDDWCTDHPDRLDAQRGQSIQWQLHQLRWCIELHKEATTLQSFIFSRDGIDIGHCGWLNDGAACAGFCAAGGGTACGTACAGISTACGGTACEGFGAAGGGAACAGFGAAGGGAACAGFCAANGGTTCAGFGAAGG